MDEKCIKVVAQIRIRKWMKNKFLLKLGLLNPNYIANYTFKSVK